MATLPLTRWRINNILRLLENALAKLPDSEKRRLNELPVGEECIRLHFQKDMLDKANSLYDDRFGDWIEKTNCVFVRAGYEYWMAQLRTPTALPKKLVNARGVDNALELTDASPIYQQVIDIWSTIKRIRADNRKAQSYVQRLLQNCSTVQQATRLWPGVVDFLDAEDTILYQEHRQRAKSKMPLNIDKPDPEIAAILIRARMAKE